jgi:CRISPR-associated protein Cmr2
MTDWNKKLAAWLHDPAEKALILMRDSVGHEWGTVQALRERLGIARSDFDRRADWLAAAADRPNWPCEEGKPRPAWANVRFTERPELVHPFSGERLELRKLSDVAVEPLKSVSFDHFAELAEAVDHDPRLTFLAFWRFGPEAGRWAKDLGALWQMLPADTRTPDHAIWAHLDTVSALHTALADGDRPALLAMSFGPVQGFIAQARSTSDLWAGSHLLSSVVWAGLKAIVADLGPDAVLFPHLRGVPAVDAWLLEQGGEAFRGLFEDIGADFIKADDDTNPQFAAALPNKFVCIVPSRRARELADKAITAARDRAFGIATAAAEKAFSAADFPVTQETVDQIGEQLAEFPEAFWASASWPMSDEVKDLDDAAERLQGALADIHPDLARAGVFSDKVWKILRQEIPLEGFQFWQPNAGMLYPTVYELAERSLAAAKTLRRFDQLKQEGHRCTQCGEREWLTDAKAKLQAPRGRRKPKGKALGEHEVETVWAELAANPKRRSWAKEGEHLCALCTAKRLWPTRFAAEVADIVGARIDRFVVSTHALAVSTSVEISLDAAAQRIQAATALGALKSTLDALDLESATLPKRLMRPLHLRPELLTVAKKLPALLERVREGENGNERIEGTDIRLGEVDRLVKDLFGQRLETYYALIQMDGDRMGAWLAGSDEEYQLRYRDTWHSQVKAEVEKFGRQDGHLEAYIRTFRPPSPARHAAISRALNDFSIHLARHIVEDCLKGKLLYAGGDDVLALVAVDDLFDAMQLLRLAYSGLAVPESLGLSEHVAWLDEQGRRQGKGKLWLSKGYGFYRGHLMTLMGHKATASMGAVVAHHQAPLAMVLRQLREAEVRAKRYHRNDPAGKNIDRDAFCIRVLKRGGGEVSVVSPWWPLQNLGTESDPDWRPNVEASALRRMKRLRDELAQTDFSRGAIYKAQQWFEGLTDEEQDARDPRWRSQVAGALAHQFRRQKGTPQVARDIVDFVCNVVQPEHPRTMLDDFLVTAEFFARESRVKSLLQQGAAP